MKKRKKKVRAYAKTALSMAISAAMLFTDMGAPVSAAEYTPQAESEQAQDEGFAGYGSTEQDETETVGQTETEEAAENEKTAENKTGQEETSFLTEEITTEEMTTEETLAESDAAETLPSETASEGNGITETNTETEEISAEEVEFESETVTEETETETEEDARELLFADTDIAHGECKDASNDFTWAIDKDGKLTVEGTKIGASGKPWEDNIRKIKSAVINIKIAQTAHCDLSYLFKNCSNLVSVDMSGSDISRVVGMGSMFEGCGSLTSIDFGSLGHTTDQVYMGDMFKGCSSLTSIDLSPLGTTSVWYMGDMFKGCSSLKHVDLGTLETSSVTNIGDMFSGCSSLTSIDLSPLNTGSVEYMYGMFQDCSSLTSIDLSSLNTSSVTDMGWMFEGCSSLTSIDLSPLETGNVTRMLRMFKDCSSLTSIDLSPLETSNVTSMGSMFSGCSSLTSIDLSPLETGSVTDMGGMFSGCSSLTSIDLSPLETSSVTSMSSMFYGCSGLTSIDLSPLETSSATSMQGMFSGCSSLTEIDLSPLETSSVTSMDSMFYGCSGLTSIDLSPLETSSVTDMWGMFMGCSGLTSIDLSPLETSSVTNMNSMFGGCSGLTSIDLSPLETSSVTSMFGMFSGCSGLASIDLSPLETSSVTKMWFMFRDCSGLTSIDLGRLDTGSVADIHGMFDGCSGLTSIDLSWLDTGSATNMSSMFSGCSGLTSIDMSGFDTGNVTNMSYMFSGCSGLTSIDMSGFDAGNVTEMDGLFGGCRSLKTIYTPRNVKTDYDFIASGSPFYDREGNAYNALPKEQADSIRLTSFYDPSALTPELKAWKAKTVYNVGEALEEGTVTADVTVMYYGTDGTVKKLGQTEYTTNASQIGTETAGEKILTVTYSPSEGETLTANIALTVGYRLDESSVTVTLTNADNYVFDKKAKKPVPVVTYIVGETSTQLEKDKDYTVLYKNNKNAYKNSTETEAAGNAPSVVIRGCGSYFGTVAKTFEIAKATAPTLGELVKNVGTKETTYIDMAPRLTKYGSVTGYAPGTPVEDDAISGNVLQGEPTIENTSNLCCVISGKAGDSVTIPVTVSFQNYEDAVLNVKIVVKETETAEKKKVTISGIEIKDSVYNKQPTSCTGIAKVTAEDGTDLTNTVKLTYTYSGTQADGSVYTATSNAPVNAGNYRLTVAVAQDNETYTGSAEISFKIAKAPLTITARDMGVKIGAPLPQAEEYLYDTTGLLAGDKLATAPVLACNITDTTAAGTYDIIPSGADAGMNYEITYKNGTLTVSETGESAAYYTVIFSMSGKGSDITNTGVKEGSTVEQPQNPTADGYTFTGWYKDKDCTVLWDFAKDTVQADTTLYAGWKANDASGGDDSGDAFPVEWEYPETLQVTSTALTEDNIEVKAKKRIYDGTPYTPDVKVTIKDAKGKKTVLTEGADYSVKYSSNVNAGERGTVKVRGNGAYTGIVTKTFTISPKPVKKLKTVTGGMIANADTNLESPEFLASLPVYVYDGTKKLTYNEDYTLTIIKGDITKKGKLQVAVSAKDGSNYTGTGKDAAKATITVYETTGKNFKGIINSDDVVFEKESDKSQTYTGKALKPEFKVTVNGTVLGKKDFSVKYTNNKEAGTAYATITGKGGYVGSVVRTFSIEPVAENGGFALKKVIKAPTYNGKVQKPKVTITSGGKTLKAGKDYRISYSNNLHATPENAADQDKAKITVTGIGNYKGMKGTFYFSINRLAIKKASVKGTQNNLVITYAKHNLVEGYDYEKPVYEPAGKKVKVTLTGQGDFTGTVTKKVKAQ